MVNIQKPQNWIPAASIVIGGSPIQWTERNSISINTTLGERSTAQVAIIDMDGTERYAKGEQVEIYDHAGELIFGGLVETARTRKISKSSPALRHQLQLKDWHYLLDKQRAAKAWKDHTAKEIIESMASSHLTPEGITFVDQNEEPTIAEGPEIGEFVSNYAQVSQVIDELASLADYWWYIDEGKVLWFQPRGSRIAPWIMDGMDIHYPGGENPTEVTHGNPGYRNRQIVLGGIERTDPQTSLRQGDGRRTTFVMPYALDSAPMVDSSIDEGATWTDESVAEEGSDQASDARWNWSKGSRDITTTFSPPATGVLMRFRYIGQYPIVVQSRDHEAINLRSELEGGSGVVTSAETVPHGPGRSTMRTIAEQRLNRFTVVGRSLTTQTMRPGLRVGQLLTVDLPDRGLEMAEMLITRMNYNYNGNQASYSITAIEGPDVSPWKSLANWIRPHQPIAERITVGESAANLVLLRDWQRIWESHELGVWSQVYPAQDLYPSTSLYPMIDPDHWVTQLAWENEGVELGRRPVTRVHVRTATRLETTVFIPPDMMNESITHLVWYGGSQGNVLLERREYQYEKNDLEALQIDRADIREG